MSMQWAYGYLLAVSIPVYLKVLPVTPTPLSLGHSGQQVVTQIIRGQAVTTTVASPAPTGLVWRLIGQHAGAPPVRPDQTGGPDLLQGKLLRLSEACSGTGEVSMDVWLQV